MSATNPERQEKKKVMAKLNMSGKSLRRQLIKERRKNRDKKQNPK